MNKNKVKFGLKNVHYAKATINAGDNTATYEKTPVRMPGAVSLSLEAQGDATKFFADDSVYFSAYANNGLEGDLELALIPDEFRKDILGEIEDKNGVMLEDAGAVGQPFALLFEFTGDQHARRYCLYNCTASRPSIEGSTKGESIEVQTETISITAAPIHIVALDKDIVKGTCDPESSGYDTWYTTVYTPEASEAV